MGEDTKEAIPSSTTQLPLLRPSEVILKLRAARRAALTREFAMSQTKETAR